jgi:ferritin-like metal-binding protein YciE
VAESFLCNDPGGHADPFFYKHGAGTELPFKITGTREALRFGLDFHHKDEHPKKDHSSETHGEAVAVRQHSCYRSQFRKFYTAFGVLIGADEAHSFRKEPSADTPLHRWKSKRRNKMQKDSLRQLYVNELKDLYNAETQLVKALPKMAKASSNAELRQGFEEHLRQTSEHVSRLEQIFDMLGEKATGKKCLGMDGLVKEGVEVMSEDYEGAVMDAAIIGAAQRVEHYEIKGYGTVRAFAELLGENDHVSLLEQTIEEEKQTDQKLTQLAEEINSQAAQGEEEEIESHQVPSQRTKRVA